MKIHTTNVGKTRSVAHRVAGKKPRGWKDGDLIPMGPRYTAGFDADGNGTVGEEAGKALVAALPHVKTGHQPGLN